MTRLYRLLYRLSRWSVWVCGFAILASTFLIFFEVLLRNVDRAVYVGSAEISGYVFAISITWGFAFCVFERAHVRIDVVYRFVGARVRLALDVLSLVALAVFAGALARRATDTLDETLLFQAVSTTPLQTPLWIPQALWAAGFIFFAGTCLFLILYILVLCLSGAPAREVFAAAGVEDEVASSAPKPPAARG
ncbi:MAG: TRAP transporter small permease [Pseudomonadota bacterium]